MSIGDEIANLNFDAMIGGPLVAVIKAQALAAKTSVDFIKEVGFDDDDQPVMVTFTYKKPIVTKDANNNPVITPTDYMLSVPLLTMVPIPFLRVEETTVDFNAKIKSVKEASSTTETNVNISAKTKAWLPIPVDMQGSFSLKNTTTSGSKIERKYSIAVHVKAVQDELPAGTEHLLNILESSIKEVPAP